jgi:hypothetical protein
MTPMPLSRFSCQEAKWLVVTADCHPDGHGLGGADIADCSLLRLSPVRILSVEDSFAHHRPHRREHRRPRPQGQVRYSVNVTRLEGANSMIHEGDPATAEPQPPWNCQPAGPKIPLTTNDRTRHMYSHRTSLNTQLTAALLCRDAGVSLAGEDRRWQLASHSDRVRASRRKGCWTPSRSWSPPQPGSASESLTAGRWGSRERVIFRDSV